MRSSTSLLGRILMGIASEMLEFLEQREQRINLKIGSSDISSDAAVVQCI